MSFGRVLRIGGFFGIDRTLAIGGPPRSYETGFIRVRHRKIPRELIATMPSVTRRRRSFETNGGA